MQSSEEIKAHLNHVAHELRHTLQSIATASDRVQTALDEVKVCNDRARFIDPTLDALNHQIHTWTEEMDRVYSLRNDEIDIYLRQENSKLKRDNIALQQALHREEEQHQAHLTEAVRSNDALIQHIRTLERLNDILRKKVAEMKDKCESALIENVELKDTIQSLQSTPGKIQRSFNLSLHCTDDLQQSTVLPILPLTVTPSSSLQRKPIRSARQYSTQIVNLLWQLSAVLTAALTKAA